MGFGYDVLDMYIETKTGPENLVKKIKDMESRSEHKRKMPPIFIPNN